MRSKIIKEHLNDPVFYDKMSVLLNEIIAARKSKAIEYEEYLRKIAELAKSVNAGQGVDTPETLDTPAKRALFNNLGKNEALAIEVDAIVKRVKPNDWRGSIPKENVLKSELFKVLKNIDEVERIFMIVKAQVEY